jgi:ABC-2 type transport system permease protein
VINLARLWRIAGREYLSYVRTVGFWLSLLLMPIALTLGASLPSLLERSGGQSTVAIVDLTGRDYGGRVQAALRERQARETAIALRLAALAAAGPSAGDAVDGAYKAGGLPAARAKLAEVAPRAADTAAQPSLLIVAPPPEASTATSADAAARALRPYLNGDRAGPDGPISAAAVIRLGDDGRPALDYWTTELADTSAENRVSAALREVVRSDDLRALGVEPARLEALEASELEVRTLSPKAQGGAEVSLSDRLPALVGFAMGMLLWSVVLTGAGILLNSVIEEKSSRILEVLLASASTAEIMGGKIAGVALVTLTVIGVWAGLGGLLMLQGAPGFAGDLIDVLVGRGLLAYFALYLLGGYLMYAAAFAAMGAFCETTREAQTLLGPVMVLLTIPVLFMSLAIRNPDAELLRILSWIPPFTPFIMAARAGGEPPLWEVAGTTAVMAVTIAAVLWLSGRAFRAGALSTVKLEPRALLAALRRR